MISAPFHLFSLFGGILSVFLGLLIFAAVIAVLFLLIRFLIVGTHAAQLYVAKNGPTPAPVAPAPSAAPSAPAESAASSVVPPSAPATPATAPATPATPGPTASAPASTASADGSVLFEEVFASAPEPTSVGEPIVGELELETGVEKVTPTRATRAGTTKTADAAEAASTSAAKKPAPRTPRAASAKPAADAAKPAAAPRPRTRKTPPPTA